MPCWRNRCRLLPVPLSRTLVGGDVGQAPRSPRQPGSHPERAGFLVQRSSGLYGPLCSFLVRKFPFPWLLPSPSQKAPSGSAWVHEIKHDGYRLIARRDGNRVRLYTRRGYDWSGKYLGLSTRFCPSESGQSFWTGKRFGLEKTAGPISTGCIPMPMTTRFSCMHSTCSN
jgi:hypothetical protein